MLESHATASWFAADEQAALADYWALYDASYDELQEETLAAVADHPELGPLVAAMSDEQREEQNRRSRALLRGAMVDGDWASYEHDLRGQGALYAGLGMSFAGWYDVLRIFQRYMVPRIVDRFAGEPERMKAVLLQSQRFLDRAMVVIGEQYLRAKESALRASEAANVRAQEANRAKTDFLAMMSHELRTPLNAIIGFSEILIDGKFGGVNERQARYLHNVHDSGKHLLGLINDLLDLSKIEAGRLEVAHEACAPRRFALDAIAMLQPLADARGVKVAVADGDAPSVVADATRFKQVLYNLLSNAIKFTPRDGRVAVTFAAVGDGRRLRIAVTDTGPGISPDDAARLFTPFSQLENARDNPRSGTGLGLALTRRLVELMGGTVGLDSALHEGSTFYFDLPLVVETPAATTAPRPSPRTRALPLVLIVDDDPAARELLQVTLEHAGYQTLQARTGEEGIALAREHRPDVIALDVFLPTIDGWDVLRILKGDCATNAIPVVMVTIAGERQQAFSLGAAEHLVKPLDRRELLAAVERHSLRRATDGDVHVLAVDDDPRQLDLVRAELEPRGFRVTTASTGRAGIEAAIRGPVDLILLDLVMPDLSGIEVAETLRRHEPVRRVPILLVTAAEISSLERRRLNGAVHAILEKGSLSTEALVSEIGRALGRPA